MSMTPSIRRSARVAVTAMALKLAARFISSANSTKMWSSPPKLRLTMRL